MLPGDPRSQWDKHGYRVRGLGIIFVGYTEWYLEGRFHSTGMSHEELGTMICQKDGVGRKRQTWRQRVKENITEGGKGGGGRT